MKKQDIAFFALVIISNIFGWAVIYLATQEKKPTQVQIENINLDDSIRKTLDTNYIFNHSEIK